MHEPIHLLPELLTYIKVLTVSMVAFLSVGCVATLMLIKCNYDLEDFIEDNKTFIAKYKGYLKKNG